MARFAIALSLLVLVFAPVAHTQILNVGDDTSTPIEGARPRLH